MSRKWSLVVALIALLVAACDGSGGGPAITDVRLGQPTGPNAALYLTATGGGEADLLIGATTEVASAVEIHQTMMSDGGTMSMQPVESLELPADGRLVLEPGGYHMMLVDVERLAVGDVIEVTLQWETAGNQTIEAEVVAPGDTVDDG